jgi:predicted ATPase
LGARDVPDRLLIPERLYGRELAVGALLAGFEQVVVTEAPALVLVSGYSGIGKSAVVNELQKALVPPRGLFASAKFDRYERNTPYATLARALRKLIEHVLAQSETELGRWRDAIQRAVGPHGRLMADLIPELELIIGGQPPVAPLPPRDAQLRFQMVLRRWVAAFARPEHPLVLFLDDLQWVDGATVDLLPQLVTDEEVGPLLLVGAYRENEVGHLHPLRRALDIMRAARAPIHEIVLEPLGLDDVRRLVADAVYCDPERSLPLAQLVHEKTAGNPFFIIQFLTVLEDEGLVAFDAEKMTWTWDLERITSKGYTDNVVALMIDKLTRVSDTTQVALQHLACLGHSAKIGSLSMALGIPEEEAPALLREAESAGLIVRMERAYAFVHDRVQEAAYALIPEERRAALHLRIGRQLSSGTAGSQRDQAAFEIVNQLNRGASLIVSSTERGEVAEFNLVAARRAMAAAAYASALSYLAAGEALLAEERWEQRGALRFALSLQRAECEIQTGGLGAAEQRLSMLAARADTLVDRAAVTRLQAVLYMTLARPDQAVERCLDYQRRTGIQWTAHPAEADVRAECDRLWQYLGDRSIESLLQLPFMTDPDQRATMDVLAAMAPAATLTDENLPDQVCVQMANLSIEHGNSDGSCYAYTLLNAVLGLRFGDYGSGYRFGQLSVDLVEQVGFDRFKARVYSTFGHMIVPWTREVRTSRPWSRRAFDAALESGDFIFWVYCCGNQINERLVSGDPLEEVQREAEAGLAFARKVRFGIGVAILVGQLLLVRMLRGLAPDVPLSDGERVDEDGFERQLESDPLLVLPAGKYWIRKLQARFYTGDYPAALEAARKAQRYAGIAPGEIAMADYQFYAALAWAGSCPTTSSDESRQHRETISAHHAQLATWAANCPENFADRAALVEAEIARLEGRELDAERLYEQAIRLAGKQGFVQNEGLANELAARFHKARGLDTIGSAYLRNARYCYERWGGTARCGSSISSTLTFSVMRRRHSWPRPLVRRWSNWTWRLS